MVSSGCSDPGCIRNSDCAGNSICQRGACVIPTDGGGTDYQIFKDAASNDGIQKDIVLDGPKKDIGQQDKGHSDSIPFDGQKDGGQDKGHSDSIPFDSAQNDKSKIDLKKNDGPPSDHLYSDATALG